MIRSRSLLPFAPLLAASVACTQRVSPRPADSPGPVVVARSDSIARHDPASRSDTVPRSYSLESQMRIWRKQDSAHTALMEMNRQVHDRFFKRFGPQTCPPESAYRAGSNRTAPTRVAARLDSVRGWIRICDYGGRALASLIVSYADSMDIALIGHEDVLRQMENLDVVVFGRRSTARIRRWPRLEVGREIVRANGAGFEALDGILRRERSGDFLELPDGRRISIPVLPEGLAGANGMRVYIAGPLDAPLQAEIIRSTAKRPTPR